MRGDKHPGLQVCNSAYNNVKHLLFDIFPRHFAHKRLPRFVNLPHRRVNPTELRRPAWLSLELHAGHVLEVGGALFAVAVLAARHTILPGVAAWTMSCEKSAKTRKRESGCVQKESKRADAQSNRRRIGDVAQSKSPEPFGGLRRPQI